MFWPTDVDSVDGSDQTMLVTFQVNAALVAETPESSVTVTWMLVVVLLALEGAVPEMMPVSASMLSQDGNSAAEKL